MTVHGKERAGQYAKVADSHIQYANNIQQTYMHGGENAGYRVTQDGRLVKLSLTSLFMISQM